MGHTYPELVERRDHVLRVIRSEEERFGETLSQGTEMLSRIMVEAKKAGSSSIPGVDAFKLYDTYGFPLELTQEMASEQGLSVDVDVLKGHGRSGKGRSYWRRGISLSWMPFSGKSVKQREKPVLSGTIP